MRDSELTERPGKGWTPRAKGPGDHDIEKVWWAAIRLHHPKLNTTTYWDGSTLVGLDHWGYRGEKWCMRKPPADHPPLPEVYRRERERAQQEALDRVRIAAQARILAQIQASGKRQSTPDEFQV
ncbi:hypothetical protein EOA27_30975 [Mesorhizobium sp. M2A.F.Ca.ET.037.01.1.1]|uniref:hypothetical protein n=1 Tax=unclassified Mesorhizobium TaxID=325217 RepID=UPI000FCA4735|nr:MULTISPECIES: hypothetical protein [unclassified Mesorhizobium]RUY10100.1 hypothetical protein EOA25_09520 [Mesorhizobium sp. M2A.F.Ca.ET.040.01.1.1]RUX03504.1 hypothetical protein EOA27_30975 [Mesorhizobium sp. M2A.F.Ca.ET.037.01.1.1]RWA93619.1 MAG: hypothetical protein EOQ31_00530 [Mesorhizobium sp.]RWX65497.1 hypothetical protein EOA24_20535 [Mesorhizobium sp. M2A.F.Ca.ET.039.01.1.1]TIV18836.1 MAG: hypothetical protein E5V95_11610 [Mesorhizobium sp.]